MAGSDSGSANVCPRSILANKKFGLGFWHLVLSCDAEALVAKRAQCEPGAATCGLERAKTQVLLAKTFSHRFMAQLFGLDCSAHSLFCQIFPLPSRAHRLEEAASPMSPVAGNVSGTEAVRGTQPLLFISQ